MTVPRRVFSVPTSRRIAAGQHARPRADHASEAASEETAQVYGSISSLGCTRNSHLLVVRLVQYALQLVCRPLLFSCLTFSCLLTSPGRSTFTSSAGRRWRSRPASSSPGLSGSGASAARFLARAGGASARCPVVRTTGSISCCVAAPCADGARLYFRGPSAGLCRGEMSCSTPRRRGPIL